MKKAIIAGLTLTMTLSFATMAMAEENGAFPQPDFVSGLAQEGQISDISPEPGTEVYFSTKDLAGNEIDSESLFAQADVTMINVWQTGCDPCVGEMSELQKLADEYAEKGCQVVTYCTDAFDEDAERIELASNIMSDYSLTAMRFDDSFDEVLPVRATPTSFFVNRDGVLLSKGIEGAQTDLYGKFFDFYLENNGAEDAAAEDAEEAEETAEAEGLFDAEGFTAKKAGFRAEKVSASEYVINVVDQDGNPVEGVMANLCDDSMCNMVKSDDKGVMTFGGKPYAYHITILKVPEGYSFDAKEELHTPEQPGTMTITIHKD